MATECHPCKKAAACSTAHAGCRDPGARSQRGKSQLESGFPGGKGAPGGKPLSMAGREGQEGLPGAAGGHSEPPASSAAVSAFRARASGQNLAAFIKGPRLPRARSRGRRSRVTAQKSSRRGPGLSLLPPPRLGPKGSWPPPAGAPHPTSMCPRGTWHRTARSGTARAQAPRCPRCKGSRPSGVGAAPRSLLRVQGGFTSSPPAWGLCQPQTGLCPGRIPRR